ncbi:MAG TPA: molybdopterin-dependent oxidoreductase, partial [Phenylobacterium sp.]|nr:molybdopterin-dependent oxidoreductase [Phenylobacterium sp.]
YAVDGLSRQRLDRPHVRQNGKLRAATWPEALQTVAARIKATSADRIGVIAGDLQDAESMKAALDLFGGLGVASLDCRQDGMALGDGPRESWLFNATLAGIEEAEVILLVGTNPRLEAPVFNSRLRKRWLAGALRVGVIGEQADLTYGYDYLGAGPESLAALAKSRGDFAKAFKASGKVAVIVGAGALSRADGAAVVKAAAGVAKTFGATWNVLHTAAARVGGLDLGFVPGEGGRSALDLVAKGGADLLFLMGADEMDLSATDAFVVYMGSHGDAGAHRADVILPGAAYTEKNGLYVNTEGRVQRGARAVFPKGEAREDWAILRALSEHLDAKLPYDSLDQLRAKLFADHPTFGRIDYVPDAPGALDLAALGGEGALSDAPFASPIKAFYLTNPIARASVTMAECQALVSGADKIAAE